MLLLLLLLLVFCCHYVVIDVVGVEFRGGIVCDCVRCCHCVDNMLMLLISVFVFVMLLLSHRCCDIVVIIRVTDSVVSSCCYIYSRMC